MTSSDPLKYDSDFECSVCKSTATSDSVETLIREYSGKFELFPEHWGSFLQNSIVLTLVAYGTDRPIDI
jgi:hypothetical protein